MATKRAHRHHAVDKIAERIAASAAEGLSFMPPEQELSNHIGVSRTVIRESMRTLSAMGLVEVRPGVGTRIMPPDSWNLFDPQVFQWRLSAGIDGNFIDKLIDFRLAIEPFAADNAAQEPNFPIDELRHCYLRMQKSVQGLGSYVEADVQFHEIILLGCHNPFFAQLRPLLSNALHLIITLTGDMSRMEAALPLHGAVIDAIEAGDGDRAASLMREMIRISKIKDEASSKANTR